MNRYTSFRNQVRLGILHIDHNMGEVVSIQGIRDRSQFLVKHSRLHRSSYCVRQSTTHSAFLHYMAVAVIELKPRLSCLCLTEDELWGDNDTITNHGGAAGGGKNPQGKLFAFHKGKVRHGPAPDSVTWSSLGASS